MLDITLLRLFRTRDKFEKMAKAVPKQALGELTQVILEDYRKYYNQFPEVQVIEFDPFWTWFKAFAHPTLSPDNVKKYEVIVQQMVQPVPPEIEAGLSERLVAANTANQITDLLERFNEGDELDLGSQLREIVEQFELETNKKVKTPWVRDAIADLLNDDQNDRGFHWRLPDVNLVMRPLIGGDFGLIAARPDVGKTTYLTDNLSHFASQMDDVYPDEGRVILWFNNEGPGKRIVKRLYQSALNATISEMLDLQKAGQLEAQYAKAVGDIDRIRVFDIHDFWNYEIDDILRQHNPGMIVFDMLDNVKFGGSANNNGQRTDQLLEAMYQWGRVSAVKYDCPVLATSQISAEGENLAFPSLAMLKDSKTGKQGAADFIKTIGFQSQNPSTRYLGLTKNKLARENGPRKLELSVIFDGQRGRYREPTLVQETPDEQAVGEAGSPSE